MPPEANVRQSEIGKLYDTISGVYDIWGALAESRARSRAIDLAEIRDGQSILEAAVGTGLAFREILRRNPNGVNVGIDISEGMLEKARLRMDNEKGSYELRNASAFEIPYPDKTFDLVVNNYMFDLVPFADMGKVIREFRRVLKDGGRLVLVNMAEAETPLGRIYDSVVYRISPRLMGGCRGVRMGGRLADNGFALERREYCEQMLFPSEIVIARKNAD